jgi:hypothetical protein
MVARLSDPQGEPLDPLRELLRRAREAAPLIPSPPRDAPAPPRPFSEVDDDRDEEGS